MSYYEPRWERALFGLRLRYLKTNKQKHWVGGITSPTLSRVGSLTGEQISSHILSHHPCSIFRWRIQSVYVLTWSLTGGAQPLCLPRSWFFFFTSWRSLGSQHVSKKTLQHSNSLNKEWGIWIRDLKVLPSPSLLGSNVNDDFLESRLHWRWWMIGLSEKVPGNWHPDRHRRALKSHQWCSGMMLSSKKDNPSS